MQGSTAAPTVPLRQYMRPYSQGTMPNANPGSGLAKVSHDFLHRAGLAHLNAPFNIRSPGCLVEAPSSQTRQRVAECGLYPVQDGLLIVRCAQSTPIASACSNRGVHYFIRPKLLCRCHRRTTRSMRSARQTPMTSPMMLPACPLCPAWAPSSCALMASAWRSAQH